MRLRNLVEKRMKADTRGRFPLFVGAENRCAVFLTPDFTRDGRRAAAPKSIDFYRNLLYNKIKKKRKKNKNFREKKTIK